VAYIVAKTNNISNNQFMMHAAAHAKEFDKKYTLSEVSRELRSQGSRLLKVDRKPSAEVQRVIVCHIKQKDLDKQKFKRNKPCKQFRKQNSKDFCEDTKFAIFKYEYVP
jgi:hypothetical protein